MGLVSSASYTLHFLLQHFSGFLGTIQVKLSKSQIAIQIHALQHTNLAIIMVDTIDTKSHMIPEVLMPSNYIINMMVHSSAS